MKKTTLTGEGPLADLLAGPFLLLFFQNHQDVFWYRLWFKDRKIALEILPTWRGNTYIYKFWEGFYKDKRGMGSTFPSILNLPKEWDVDFEIPHKAGAPTKPKQVSSKAVDWNRIEEVYAATCQGWDTPLELEVRLESSEESLFYPLKEIKVS